LTNRVLSIYKPASEDGFEICHPIDHQYFSKLNDIINGVPRKDSWQPVEVEIFGEDQGKKLQESDSPWLGGQSLIFRSRAVKALKGMLERYGELLPLARASADLYIYNPTLVLDALDESASTIWRFPSGKIMGVRRYVFRLGVVQSHNIFRLSGMTPSLTFLSQEFVDSWKSAGLRGLEFELIWSSQC